MCKVLCSNGFVNRRPTFPKSKLTFDSGQLFAPKSIRNINVTYSYIIILFSGSQVSDQQNRVAGSDPCGLVFLCMDHFSREARATATPTRNTHAHYIYIYIIIYVRHAVGRKSCASHACLNKELRKQCLFTLGRSVYTRRSRALQPGSSVDLGD